MGKTNAKSEVEARDFDLEHELPAGDDAAESGSPNDPAAARSSTPASQAEAELQKLKAERDSLLDRLARMQAEFENARRRSAKEQQDFREYAVMDTVKALLPILDSFERALQASDPEAAEFRNGVELIYKQLQDALVKQGLRPVPAKGEPFNPHLHEAIEMVDTRDADDHEVLEELQRGYKLKDRLLRPSMVKVARNPKS